MSYTAKTPPVAKSSNNLPANAVDGTHGYDIDKSQYVVSVSNDWRDVGGGFVTPTVIYDDGAAVGNTNQIQGDIPADWKQNDTSLKGLVIGTSCTSIGDYAFNNCTSLTGSLVIPDSVTTIGFASIQLCSGLTSLIIGNNVTTIGSAAFYFCSNLTGHLIIPDSVTTIGGTGFGAVVFAGCAFTNITIGQNVTFIGDWSFGFNSGLTNINCYVTKTIIEARDQVFINNSNFTLHVRSSDNTWTAGSGQSIAGASNVNVIKDL